MKGTESFTVVVHTVDGVMDHVEIQDPRPSTPHRKRAYRIVELGVREANSQIGFIKRTMKRLAEV